MKKLMKIVVLFIIFFSTKQISALSCDYTINDKSLTLNIQYYDGIIYTQVVGTDNDYVQGGISNFYYNGALIRSRYYDFATQLENFIQENNSCPMLHYNIDVEKNTLTISTSQFSNSNIITSKENRYYQEDQKYDSSSKMFDYKSCSKTDYNYIYECGCIPSALADITTKIYFLLRILAPTLLLILGGISLAKAIGSDDGKDIEKAKKTLVKKFIAAAAVFFVLTTFKWAVMLFSNQIESSQTFTCLNYLIDGYNV